MGNGQSKGPVGVRGGHPTWETMGVAEVLARLGGTTEGLSSAEAEARRVRWGVNALLDKGQKGPGRIFLNQWTSTMVVVLLVAAAVSFLVGDGHDAVVILAIVFLNSLLGFVQEYRAEKSLAALKKMAVPRVRARRDGRWGELSSHDLVPGDLVALEAGNQVPADGRLVEAVNLRVQEASLTGESEPVDKHTGPLPAPDVPLGDQRNRVFLGTGVTYGHGVFVVCETGMSTELGRIAGWLQSSPEEHSPLQRRLDRLGNQLAGVALAMVSLLFLWGVGRGESPRLMFLTAVSLAVAAVPEGLPAVVTIALALGAQRMLKRRALIRKLPAVESLGSVDVICSDKTGTLTENRMTVTALDVAGHRLTVGNDGAGWGPLLPAPLRLLLLGGALCNDAVLHVERNDVRFLGDPTEGAFLLAAWHGGMEKEGLDRAFPRTSEVPFDSVRKRMTTAHRFAAPKVWTEFFGTEAPRGDGLVFSKGAVGSLLEICDGVWVTDRREPLTDVWRQRIESANDALAAQGMRVLGVAFRALSSHPTAEPLERSMVFVGLVGMIDPPRPEVREAIRLCRTAGIRPIMITGDHPLTAQHIARQLGFDNGESVLTGSDLDRFSAPELESVVERGTVFARVSPEHKLRIVESLQKRGHVVAMTGDGVNDAPALKRADIGVAMGMTGTDVAKESSDMVLLDDHFATIVAAVAEGRVIYDNIRKFMRYLLTTNSAEILVMVLGPLFGMPLPLLPLQILWINLVTDGLPALALGVEPGERQVMDRPPVRPQEGILSRGLGLHVAWVGLWMCLLSLGVGYVFWRAGDPCWQTALFTTLAFGQMGHVVAIRSEKDSLFRRDFISNPWLLGAVASTLVAQLTVIYTPPLGRLFGTVPLGPAPLGGALGAAGLVVAAVEVEKLFRARPRRAESPPHIS